MPTYEQGSYQLYKLRVNDELMIRVITTDKVLSDLFPSSSGSSANQVSYRVFEDGMVEFPFLEPVKLEGLTLEEAEQLVTEKMRSFVSDIQVRLALSTNTFCVIGAAGRGYFPIYKERLTIFQALALSGGISEGGDYSKVKIIRETDEGTKIISFDIRSKSVIDSEFYYVYPNDIIYVDVSKKKFWAINSYAGFLGVITSSITLLLTVWNLAK
ncbi:MAG TPA: polysaccharide biosynthesis/export family protein [Paludibacteraceae bacterium]|nr:polysaccharide biosynthesis/export family protein [Paludibacteraceae bacterium]